MVEFEPVAARAPVEDEIDPAVEIGRDMSRRRGAHPARPVGGGRGERNSRRLDQRPGDRMRGRAQGHAVEARAREQADPAGRGDGQDQGERPGPEGASQRLGLAAEQAVLPRGLDVEDMGDERIDRRPLLGGVDRRDRLVRGRVGGEAVDGFRRHGDEAARAQGSGPGGDRLRAGRLDAGHPESGRPLLFRSALRANSTVH